MENSPYAYYNNKLGIKAKYITSDRCHEDSIALIKYNALYKRLKSKTCTEQELRRASLNIDALVLFSSLSRDWKDAITTKFGNPKEESKKSWFAEHYVADREAFNFFSAHRYGDKQQKKLDIKLLEQYTYDASVLNTVIKMKANRKAYAKARGVTRLDIWQSLSNDVNAFREVPHNLPANKDSLRRKTNKYLKSGYVALISGRLQNSNAKKVIQKDQMALLDELIAKHTNLDNEMICSIYNVVAEQMDWKTITAGTVANRKNKSKLVTHAGRNGIKSLRSNILMQVKRKKPSTPMLYWTMDGWDAELLYQEVKINAQGHRKTTYHNRLTIVVILDPFNNYPVGYAVGTHETPKLIRKAIQNAMQHVKSLFGDFYMPYQLQSDRYSKKKLTPIYEAITKNYTPAKIGNAKSKVIEPYFNTLNKKYCKLLNNWSGHNVDSGSKNQPNDEYLDKIKKTFPNQAECADQLVAIIEQERSKKLPEYTENWLKTKEEFKHIMSFESYMLTLGENTGYTNKLKGEGLVLRIDGQKYWYDSFDLNFRHQSDLDWSIQYDTNDLRKVLAVSSDGRERFVLEQKYIQPMAIADQTDEDEEELLKIHKFNKKTEALIIDERANNVELIAPILNSKKVENTLAKLLLTDSLGQHKDNKSNARNKGVEKGQKLIERDEKKMKKQEQKTFADEQMEYYKNKSNINEYL